MAGTSVATETQIAARGFSADRVYSSEDVDSINLFNGNLTLAIPIGLRYPLNESNSYGLTLVYNSNVWDLRERLEAFPEEHVFTTPYPSGISNAGLGWTLTLGMLFPPRTDLADLTDPTNQSNNWMYVSPDGSSHLFYEKLHTCTGCDDDGSTTTEYTRDSTYLRMRVVAEDHREIDLPDGTTHSFRDQGSDDWRLEEIRDQYGNSLTIAYFADRWEIADSHGRQHTVWLQPDPELVWIVDSVELAAFAGGSPAVFEFEYQTTEVQRCYRNTDSPALDPDAIAETQLTPYPLLTRVEFLSGTAGASSFEMTDASDTPAYLTDCGGGNDIAGAITGIRLRTGGRIEWDYGPFRMPAERGLTVVSGVRERRELEAGGTLLGTWLYSNEFYPLDDGVNDPEETWTYVVFPSQEDGGTGNPDNHCTKHYFQAHGGNASYGLPFSTTEPQSGGLRLYDLSTEAYESSEPGGLFPDGTRCAGTKLRSSYVSYEGDAILIAGNGNTDLYNNNRRVAGTRTVYHDDGNRWFESESTDFDGYGHYRHTREKHDIDVSSGTDERSFRTDYNPEVTSFPSGFQMIQASEPWILSRYDRTKLLASNGRTDQICFDDSGFLTARRKLVSGNDGDSPDDRLEIFDRDAAGHLVRERYYGGYSGGVLQAIPENLPVCDFAEGDGLGLAPQYEIVHGYENGALASSKYVDAAGADVLVTVDQDIDASTGLVAASRDASGLETTYGYDGLGRVTLAQPQAGGGARTELNYTEATGGAPASVVVTQRPNQGGAKLAEEAVEFDAFGRVAKEERLHPDGNLYARTTSYTPRGWKEAVTEWGVASSTQFLKHDAFGRPRRIIPPDGPAHDVTLSYSGVRQVDRTVSVRTSTSSESLVTTSEFYDGFGRLIKVIEPSIGGGTAIATVYDYDGRGNLLKAKPDGATSYDWSYDRLGNLTMESVRDLGGRDFFYLEYDARDHPARVRNSFGSEGSGLRLTYDRAERVAGVHEVVGEQRLLKEFEYATQNVGANLRKGKLWKATRHNYLDGADVEIEEDYIYEGVGGRVSEKLIRESGSLRFQQAFSWTDLGGVEQVSYPDCQAGGCGEIDSRSVDYSYTNGLLTRVSEGAAENATEYASSISYQPNLMPYDIIHGNGVTDRWIADPDGMRRPRRIVTLDTANPFDSGVYAYDGAGNITAMGADSFLYDEVSRLVSGTAARGAAVQTVVYDKYGSIREITTDGVTRWFKVSNTFSKLESGCHGLVHYPNINERRRTVLFDEAGNLTRWAALRDCKWNYTWSQDYVYDALNMMIEHREHLGPPWNTPANRTSRFIYTADDERIGRIEVDESRTFWTVRDLNGKVLRTFEENNASGAWSWVKDFIWRDGKLLVSREEGGALKHYHLDHLGSPRLVTNSAGGFHRRHDYYPFGDEYMPTDVTEVMRYTGHEKDFAGMGGGDKAGDLEYMHARYYSPGIGRFLSVDPIKSGRPANPQSWNRYTYGLNNPLKFVDPNGLEPIEANVKQFLEAFFGPDLSHIDVQTGKLARAITGVASAPGVTIGNNIYLSEAANEVYLSRNLAGVELLGHEVVHTFDYQRLGVGNFLANYFGIQAFRGFMETGTRAGAYHSITFEQRAFATQAVLSEFLRTEAGRGILGKLGAGEALSAADRKAIDAFLVQKITDGQLKLGLQFVEGQLVFVRMAK